MLHPISNISKTQERSSDSYRILNPHALEKRVQHCASEALGKNSAGPCTNWDILCVSDGSCGWTDSCGAGDPAG